MKTIILGPPGTGKTPTLLNLVDQFIQDGIRPKQIGYFSFTKKAATEAATRAADKFGLDVENDLAFFRTLHSYAFNQLGMTKEKMMGPEDYKEMTTGTADYGVWTKGECLHYKNTYVCL